MATDNGKFYVGVSGVAQTASKIYLGVNGVAKCVYDSAGGGGTPKSITDLFTTTSSNNIKGYIFTNSLGTTSNVIYRGFSSYSINPPSANGSGHMGTDVTLSNMPTYGIQYTGTNETLARQLRDGVSNSESGYYLSLGASTYSNELMTKFSQYSSTGNNICLSQSNSFVGGARTVSVFRFQNLNTNILNTSSKFKNVIATRSYQDDRNSVFNLLYSDSDLNANFSNSDVSLTNVTVSSSSPKLNQTYGFITVQNGAYTWIYNRAGYYLEFKIHGSGGTSGSNCNCIITYGWHNIGDVCSGFPFVGYVFYMGTE